MARSVITAIEINDGVLFAPGGDVRQWCVGVTREVKTAAKAFAPPGRSMARHSRGSTGRLRAGIRGTTTGFKRIDMNITSTADYSLYVLGGTAYQGQRFIYSTLGWANKGKVDIIASRFGTPDRFKIPKGWAMSLPAGAGHRAGPRLRVKGQRSNPFLTDGYNLVAARHSALPPMRSQFIFS